ncbi:hypothetical protein Q5O24_13180 [Eubacteriaceae bacterium ES3]|nr:hypothetical protein Q5O24_13180 [Eubacteriaceae bacterium ES3]
MNSRLEQWYNRYQEKKSDLKDSEENKEQIESDYLEWKTRYPFSIAENQKKLIYKERNKD